MNNPIVLAGKTARSLVKSGPAATLQKINQYRVTKKPAFAQTSSGFEPFMDVLFINGCDPEAAPHPPRYRVAHQKEQLIANGIVSNEVYYLNLSMDQVRSYRVFIFFRCPYTPLIGKFITEAKRLHRPVLFDIDDLVIDTKYTDTIPYVKSLDPEGKALYDDGVIRMGKTLSLCDAAITTTERLAEELRHYVPEVIINRNTASERMLRLSEAVLKTRDHKQAEKDGEAPSEAAVQRKKGWWRSEQNEHEDVEYDPDAVKIGYFSGSITHNADFELILPAVIRILHKYPKTQFHVVGELDLPEELEPFKARIIKRKFVPWEKLPALIGSVDINLAPLEESIFNEAKSENKWVEAALVKVPTVASNFGAFRRMIEHGRTGLLCDTSEEWYSALESLVINPSLRQRLAAEAYSYCRRNCVTLYTGFSLTKYIRSKMTPNIAFILPSLEISGGIMVALKHAKYLYESGLDVFLISEVPGSGYVRYEDCKFPVISKNHHPMYGRIDKAVATMWTTVQFLEIYPNIGQKYYLVQNFEVDFYAPENFLRIQANQSYSPSCPIRFLTISQWCKNWLLERYEQEARYAPNGINGAHFRPHERSMTRKKIRILVEGDCAVDYKNVDESFRIVDKLAPDRFEIWYMSYNAEPKKKYRVDRFLHRVPYEKVFEVYAQCDILIKSSILESFSYPPLEMMASGGFVVVRLNDGNAEFIKDGENCLTYSSEDLDGAVAAIERICSDPQLRKKLYEGGLLTVAQHEWATLENDILALYDVRPPTEE